MGIRFPVTAALLALLCGLVIAAPASTWVGTWAAAPQPYIPGTLATYEAQTLRLIVHTSTAGTQIRVTLSNLYGEVPLKVADVHVAIRATGANIEAATDRALRFHGRTTVTVGAHGELTSDAVHLAVPALSDLAISFFLPEKAAATTSHLLALQTSYLAAGDVTSTVEFPVLKTIDAWPFLTEVDVTGPADAAAVAVLGSSTTDGDGSSEDKNRRWPDALARRLQQAGGALADIGVLNLGIIGNRLLRDSPQRVNSALHGARVSTYWNPHAAEGSGASNRNPFGAGLGEAGLTRFEHDVIARPGVKYLIVCMGINDIVFPGSFSPPDEAVSAESLIAGYLELIRRAHQKGIRVLLTTIPPFEDAIFSDHKTLFYTLEKEHMRQAVNDWIRTTQEADAVADFDAVLRDPARPTKLLERFDAGDHIHSTDEGYAATAAIIPLSFFARR